MFQSFLLIGALFIMNIIVMINRFNTSKKYQEKNTAMFISSSQTRNLSLYEDNDTHAKLNFLFLQRAYH